MRAAADRGCGRGGWAAADVVEEDVAGRAMTRQAGAAQEQRLGRWGGGGRRGGGGDLGVLVGLEQSAQAVERRGFGKRVIFLKKKKNLQVWEIEP